MSSPPSLSSLRLLLPPLRLLTAAMWQVARRRSVKHYGMLEDFVSMVTEAVPQLLTERQRSLLLLALRAKVTLCDPQAVHTQLDQQLDQQEDQQEDQQQDQQEDQQLGQQEDQQLDQQEDQQLDQQQDQQEDQQLDQPEDQQLGQQLDQPEDQWSSGLLTLTDSLVQSPADRQRLLQEVFDHSFDSALQALVSDFLSRIDQLFPVPDFKQASSWLDAAPGGLEECLQEADRHHLRELLTNQSCSLGQATTSVGLDSEMLLLSAWSHPLLTKLTNPAPPPSDSEVQSEQLPDVELVKVEVVVMTEEEDQEAQEETVIGQSPSSNESPAEGGDECDVTPVVLEMDRLKDSPGNSAVQSEDRADQSQHTCPEVTANALYSISHNSQRVAHKCPQCGKCFIYRSQVIRHLRTNKSCGSALMPTGPANMPSRSGQEACTQEPRPRETRPLRTQSCFQCNAIFRTRAELLAHQRSHRARPVYQCAQCDKEFHHLSSLTNHKQTHLVRGSRCDKSFESAKERDAHRLQHRLPDLTCTVCDQAFGSQTQLLRHLQSHSVEGAEPCYNCRFCEQSFSGVTQLRIHQRSHTFRSYQCDQCSKTYGSLTGLHSHRASHTAESRFLCPQCGKRFKTRDGLEGHLRTHTGERPYRCPYCPKDFTALAGLNVHVRRHTGERPYVCKVCGKGWPSGGDLQKHMRTHTGERPYVCQECGKGFSISCHLTEHRRIHTGEKPFSCPQCGKCLRRKFDLKKHMLSHSDVRPYACVSCPKSYTRKTHLNRHLLTHRAAGGQVEAETSEAIGTDY